MDQTTARRAVLGSVVTGGLLGVAAAPAGAAGGWKPSLLPATRLRTADLIVGPDGRVVRVASRREISGGRIRIRYSHPNTGEPTPMSEGADVKGYAPKREFVVLARDVPLAAVTLTEVPPPTDPTVIDGGAP